MTFANRFRGPAALGLTSVLLTGHALGCGATDSVPGKDTTPDAAPNASANAASDSGATVTAGATVDQFIVLPKNRTDSKAAPNALALSGDGRVLFVATRDGSDGWPIHAYERDTAGAFQLRCSIAAPDLDKGVGTQGDWLATSEDGSVLAFHEGTGSRFAVRFATRSGSCWTKSPDVSTWFAASRVLSAAVIDKTASTLFLGDPRWNMDSVTGPDSERFRAGAVAVVHGGSPSIDNFFAPKMRNGASFGTSLAFASTANRLVVGEPQQNTPRNAYDSTEPRNEGAVYVFDAAASRRTPLATLTARNPDPSLRFFGFGESVAVSDDATRIFVGAPAEKTGTQKAGEDGTGAVHVFERSDASWKDVARLAPAAATPGVRFGDRIAASASGNVLVVAANDLKGTLGSISSRAYTVWRRSASGAWSSAELFGSSESARTLTDTFVFDRSGKFVFIADSRAGVVVRAL